MDIILTMGIILTSGYFFGLIAERLSFPRVSAYLLAGILFSEPLLGHIVDLKLHLWAEPFSNICLGFIAYIIGGEINLKTLKKKSKTILTGTLFESLTPVFLVFTSIYILCYHFELSTNIALILASICATTAPATTFAIIEQYKAKGELTDTTLGVVALDDAFGIIIFIAISSVFFPNGIDNGFITLFKELFLSITIGVCGGFLLSKFSKLSISNDFLFPLLVGLVLIIVSLAKSFHFSALLALIILGLVANNTNIKEHKRASLILPIQHIEEFIFITFFVFAGSHFSPTHFSDAIIFILTYAFFRALGKYIGAFVGLTLSPPDNIKTKYYLGFALLPQAGVAIGLLFQAINNPHFNDIKDLLLNIILGSTIIYELIGPFSAKFAFKKAKEI